ncbi:MAG TPA: RNA polymerase sigma-54 factor, partial [Flavobacteriales bacterium]
MKMLQIPTMELDQRIKDEMEINPALEEGSDDSDYDEQAERDPELDNNDEFDNDTTTDERENDDIDITDYFDQDDIPDYKLKVNNHSADDEERDTPLGAGRTFQDLLYDQL